MALVWVEPWDQYGTTVALVANSGYTDVGLSGFNAPGRTGLKTAWIFNSGTTRIALNTAVTTMGQGGAFAPISGISGDSSNNIGFRFESAGKVIELAALMLSDLSIGVYDRTGTLKGRTPPNQMIIGSFVWVEAKVIGNTAGANTGSCEIRINGISKLTVNGLNLPNAFTFAGVGGSTNTNTNFDDWLIWDNTGIVNNDFMGDRRLFVSYPNANLALQDFTPTPAGNAWDRLNDSPPVDTAYIEGAAAGNISEFSKDAVGINSTSIAAVAIIGRLFKSDAGVASGRLGINSNGFVNNSAEQFPGTTGAWFRNIVELDPNGTIPWTRAAVDASAVRITRVQ